jgi:hypothetical protein
MIKADLAPVSQAEVNWDCCRSPQTNWALKNKLETKQGRRDHTGPIGKVEDKNHELEIN